jgi:membrane protein involved in colicin uptake
MKRALVTKSSVLGAVILFSLLSGVALAEKKHWFVVKDQAGACRVIEAESVSGPFKTMAEAEKRKDKDCPKGTGQSTEQLHQQRDQAEPLRRQHPKREDAQQQQLKQHQKPEQQLLKEKQTPHQQQEQTEKMRGKAQEKIDSAKPSEEKLKEKAKEPIPSDKKN